jgi:NADH dehydrogenase
MTTKKPRVVIVGAGFGGLSAARALAHAPVDVLIVDRNNYHTFQALLYQVASAELAPGEIGYPVRGILRNLPNAEFAMAEVRRIDMKRHIVEGDGLEIAYDYLIIATGSVSNFFGVAGAAENSFPLKTLEDALRLRNHILGCFERAVHETEPAERERLTTFVVVGGGATGVEFAGALSELFRGTFAKDFRKLNTRNARVILLEASDHLLPGFPHKLYQYTLERLNKMGVEVRLNAAVEEVSMRQVTLQDDTIIPTETTVWAAGVQGNSIPTVNGVQTERGNRVKVLPTMQVDEHPEAYVIGDLAYIEQDDKLLPLVAPVAIQQGKWAARNIREQMAGRKAQPFIYRDPGAMVTIGRNAAVARLGGRLYTGSPAWVLWLVVHLIRLVGHRNRLFVLLSWAWDYLVSEKAIRVILRGG